MIFAVFDVLLAVNMCINYSFFYNYLLYMSDSFLLIYLFVYSEHDIENILSCVMMKWLF